MSRTQRSRPLEPGRLGLSPPAGRATVAAMPTADTALSAAIDRAIRARITAGALPLRAHRRQAVPPWRPCRGLVLRRGGRARVGLIAEERHALLSCRGEPGQPCAITASCLVAEKPCSAEAAAEAGCEGLMLSAALLFALVQDSAA